MFLLTFQTERSPEPNLEAWAITFTVAPPLTARPARWPSGLNPLTGLAQAICFLSCL